MGSDFFYWVQETLGVSYDTTVVIMIILFVAGLLSVITGGKSKNPK